MKNLFFLLIFLFIGCDQETQKEQKMKLNWDVDSVRVYAFYDLGEMRKFTEKELENQKSTLITDPRLSELFHHALYNENYALWKGGHLGVVNFKDGFKMKIAISHYGGFFYIIGQKGYYYFEDPKNRQLWEDLFFGEGSRKSPKKDNP